MSFGKVKFEMKCQKKDHKHQGIDRRIGQESICKLSFKQVNN